MRFLVAGIVSFALALPVQTDEARAEKGTVEFVPTEDQEKIPARYRLEKNRFDYEMKSCVICRSAASKCTSCVFRRR